jgi:hypothetical protein
MKRTVIVLGWLALAAMAAGASLLYVRETAASRSEREATSARLYAAVMENCRRMELRESKSNALLNRLSRGQDDLRRLLERSSVAASEPIAISAQETPVPLTLRIEEETTPENNEANEGELPPLPQGLNPVDVLRTSSDLKAIVQDPRLNPAQRELNRADKFKLHAEFVHAKAKIEMLEADIHVAITGGIERMREHGEYIEYENGENYRTEPGVLTAGEETPDGGVRMFYLYPDDFAGVYSKRAERDQVAETAVRRVLRHLQGEKTEKSE